jgi:hypothetical protein
MRLIITQENDIVLLLCHYNNNQRTCISPYCAVILFFCFSENFKTNFFACVEYQENEDIFHISATSIDSVTSSDSFGAVGQGDDWLHQRLRQPSMICPFHRFPSLLGPP